jgi:methylamine---glutamate N-methyltransferase subunit B
MPEIDLAKTSVRELNGALHALTGESNQTLWLVKNPGGKHAIAAGLDAPATIEVEGPVGYYCAGMNKQGTVIVHGNAGTGVAENMMSGEVWVKGDASQSAGATGRGGLLVIDGDIGAMSAFMAQAGNLVVLGGAGENLGDSIYEARLFVRGPVKSLGADCIEKELTPDDHRILTDVLTRAGINGEAKPDDFRLYGSARTLYHFHVDNAGSY